MRISDWSADVCSSDLARAGPRRRFRVRGRDGGGDRGRGPPSAPPPASRRALRARILASIGELAVKASAFDAVLALYQHRPSPPPNPGEARPRSARVDDGERRLGGGQDAPIVEIGRAHV